MVEQVSDFKMPEKVVTRLLKDALPDNVVISKDAKNAACRSASVFILQLSMAAVEKAYDSKRRHLENQDIFNAVRDLGLAEYTPQLVRFGAQRKRNAKRKESSLLMKSKPSKRAPDDQPQEDISQKETAELPMDWANRQELDDEVQHHDQQEDEDDHHSNNFEEDSSPHEIVE